MLAEYTDTSEAEVVNSAIKYFLLTWEWKTKGLYGKRLPKAGSQYERTHGKPEGDDSE